MLVRVDIRPVSKRKGWNRRLAAKIQGFSVNEQEREFFYHLSMGDKVKTASQKVNHSYRWGAGIIDKYMKGLECNCKTAVVSLLIREGII